jgi:hypothetical protein
MQDPRDLHWIAVKSTLHYLNHSITHGLLIRPCRNFQLVAFLDASGYYTFLGPNILSWNSKKQPIVSQSNTKAEYKALVNATVELTWPV